MNFKGGSVLFLAGLVLFGLAGFLFSDASQAERSRLYVPQKNTGPQEDPLMKNLPPPEPIRRNETEMMPPPYYSYGDWGAESGKDDPLKKEEDDLKGGEDALSMEEPPDCDFSGWIGRLADENIIKETGRPYRILHPGSMVTQDYSPHRINVHVDRIGVVTEVTCG